MKLEELKQFVNARNLRSEYIFGEPDGPRTFPEWSIEKENRLNKIWSLSELGILKNENLNSSDQKNGTFVIFFPDESIFKNYKYRIEYVEKMIKYYVFLNPGLTIVINDKKFFSDNGLKDLLEDQTNINDFIYPIIHLKGNDIEVAITHSRTQYSEEYYSFVNGQYTVQGGTHKSAFREAIIKTIRDFYGKNYESSDIRKSIISAISIKEEI